MIPYHPVYPNPVRLWSPRSHLPQLWPRPRIPGFRIPARQASGFWIPAESRLRPPFFGSAWWLSGGAQRRSEENFAVQSLKRPRIPDSRPSADSPTGATTGRRCHLHAVAVRCQCAEVNKTPLAAPRSLSSLPFLPHS
jgi:hypothetical protein